MSLKCQVYVKDYKYLTNFDMFDKFRLIMFASKVLPNTEELYPGENPELKLLSLCKKNGQAWTARHLGVSESAVSKMLKRIRNGGGRSMPGRIVTSVSLERELDEKVELAAGVQLSKDELIGKIVEDHVEAYIPDPKRNGGRV